MLRRVRNPFLWGFQSIFVEPVEAMKLGYLESEREAAFNPILSSISNSSSLGVPTSLRSRAFGGSALEALPGVLLCTSLLVL
jgi:hypothetical protein